MPDPVSELERRIRAVLVALPRQIGEVAVNFALDNWKRQGFLAGALQPWQPRRTVTKKNKGKPILVATGRLRRSISVLRVDRDTVVVGSNVPYARVHNDGFYGSVKVAAHQRGQFVKEKRGTGKLTKTGKERMMTVRKQVGQSDVRAHDRKMNIHKRQFLGNSPYLEANIKRLIAFQILKAARTT